ncbi:MAG: aldo/keto reductase [Candidatus Eisenbacteria bacterium]|uniref:Aldo/keto reductase n=1 Tax=Eiseniibacteriota bacterium TaxID=2212470 RepID=A0A7Y2E9I0_UNCEI|nr:aldo/keto reductase [Candidatus Eisenbacteria bacterium]
MLSHRVFGKKAELKIQPVGTGLWAVPGSQWGPAEDQTTLEAIETALEAGCNFFDTADVYGGGHSEELLGSAMKGRRDKFVVASKIGWLNYNEEGNRTKYDTIEILKTDVEAALKRLKTDYLDVLQCHVFYEEPNTPIFIDGFRQLQSEGKIKAWGVSTSDPSLLKVFNRDGDCDVLQVDYSILNRTAEVDLLPYCAENNIGVIVRGPIAMGLLADKFDRQTRFPDGDFRQAWTTDSKQRLQFAEDLKTVERLRSVVPADQSMAQFALRFAYSHPAITTIIPGARNATQAAANTATLQMGVLSTDELNACEAIVPFGGGRKIWPA